MFPRLARAVGYWYYRWVCWRCWRNYRRAVRDIDRKYGRVR